MGEACQRRDDSENLAVGVQAARDRQASESKPAIYLDVDPIELVEANPRASLRQPTEELSHHLVVYLVRAVEHHAQDANRLGFGKQMWSRDGVTATTTRDGRELDWG